MKGFSRSMDSYLAKSAKMRDFPHTYISRRTMSDKVNEFFSNLKYKITRKTKLVKFPLNLGKNEPVDLSKINFDETYVITGKPSSKAKRFWRRLKAAFKDDASKKASYGKTKNFELYSPRPKMSISSNKQVMSDTVDLAAVARTLEKGRIRLKK